MILVLPGGWGAWTARLEVDQAVHPIATEARLWSTVLTAQRQARHQEIVAEEAAQQDERQAVRTALAEARARQHEAAVALQAAAAQADVFARMQTRRALADGGGDRLAAMAWGAQSALYCSRSAAGSCTHHLR